MLQSMGWQRVGHNLVTEQQQSDAESWAFLYTWTLMPNLTSAIELAALPMGFTRQEHGSGCHFLLQGIFSTLGENPDLLHCKQILQNLSHQGSPQNRIALLFCQAKGDRELLPWKSKVTQEDLLRSFIAVVWGWGCWWEQSACISGCRSPSLDELLQSLYSCLRWFLGCSSLDFGLPRWPQW